MAKADVLSLVQLIGADQADAGQIDRYYSDVVYALAQKRLVTNVSLIPTTFNTAIYSFPASAVELISVFYDDYEVRKASIAECSSYYGSNWRDVKGSPVAYVTENEADRTFRLVPQPQANSKDFIFSHGRPLGLDYPDYAAAVLHTEFRQDLPVWLELPVALDVAAREFSRDSDHRDLEFANITKQIAEFLYAMVR